MTLIIGRAFERDVNALLFLMCGEAYSFTSFFTYNTSVFPGRS